MWGHFGVGGANFGQAAHCFATVLSISKSASSGSFTDAAATGDGLLLSESAARGMGRAGLDEGPVKEAREAMANEVIAI